MQRRKMIKMKTKKQYMKIRMLLVIPASLTIVTTTMQNVKAITAESRDREGDFNDDGLLAGMGAGKAQAAIDERSGIDNDSCGINHSNPYCQGYGIKYAAEHIAFNLLHKNSR
jgi:hypothetical protein